MDPMQQEEREEFLLKVRNHFEAISQLIEEYGLEDKIIAASVIGVLDPVDSGTSDMSAIYAMNLENRDEMEVVIDFIRDAYNENDPDLSDLLGGLGISLN